jgi:hypothetical protein
MTYRAAARHGSGGGLLGSWNSGRPPMADRCDLDFTLL